MMDEAKVEAYRNTILCDVHEQSWLEILETLSAALKVVRAAQKASAEKEHTNCWHDEMEASLAPFAEAETKTEGKEYQEDWNYVQQERERMNERYKSIKENP
jgi:hypothetical protein